MSKLKFNQLIILIIHALIGWGLCGAVIGIGRNLTTMENTMIIHLLAVPVIFATISNIYFRKFNYTSPCFTATFFLFFVIFMDFFLVAMFLEKSFEMFTSLIGTWIPFLCIFVTTCLTGYFITRKQ